MKIYLRIVLLVVVMGSGLFARQSFARPACLLTLEWQASPDSSVAGYTLYYGVVGGPITNRMDVGLQTVATVNGLTASVEYSFYAVAYDVDQNESIPSNPLLYSPQAISSLKLSQSSGNSLNISFSVAPGAACQVEYTDSLTPPNWNLLTAATGDSNGVVTIDDPITTGSRFYRGMVQ